MKNVLIVGASSGIGFELAHRLSTMHSMWLAGRRTPDIEHNQHIIWDAVSEPFPDNELPEELSGLVYAPGNIRLQPFSRLKDEHYREVFELNLVGAVRAVRAALPSLKAAATSSVVLFSTAAVTTVMPMHASVAAATERHPLGRIGQPKEAAAAVRYLLSPVAGWVTGQVLHVDGGMSGLRRFG